MYIIYIFKLKTSHKNTADVELLHVASLVSHFNSPPNSPHLLPCPIPSRSFPVCSLYFLIQSTIEQVQNQTDLEQLSREVKNLKQLLLKMAEKQGIHLDPEEAERQVEQEAQSHP